jgi:UDP-N-acetylglucosamine 2-epimerase
MIAIVLGTMAELIKTFPVMLELDKRKIKYTFIHTGQHGLENLCDDLGVRRPDIVLSEPPRATTKFWTRTVKAISWLIFLIPRIWWEIRKLKPDFVIYHGDTMSTSGASIASSKFLNPGKKWMNVHLEAGLRSGSIFEPFPEEISRKVSTLFSDILFAPSGISANNLRTRKNVFNVGNTVVDAINMSWKMALKKGYKTPKGYVLVTIHRHENIKSRKRMEKIVEIVSYVKKDTYWPLHDNTRKRLEGYNLMECLKKNKKIHIVPIKKYVEFSLWLRNCDYVITDGGSIQEETLALKKPSILLRKKTERVAGLETGVNFLTGIDVGYAKEMIDKLEDFKVPKYKNPYGKGDSSKKIVDILEKFARR